MTDASQSRSRPTDPSSRSAGTAAGPAPRPTGTLDPTGLAWFEARGLDAELVVRYGIESATVPGGGDWVAFPCLRDGAVVNHKYRRLDRKDFRQDKGCPQVLWNLDCLGDKTLASHPVVFTEGEVDCLSAIQGGFPRSVSFSAGAPSAPLHGEGAKYASVADTLGKLADVRDIILAVDNDGPGLALMADLSVRLGKGRCRYVVYPGGCKDLNDVLLAHGERGVAEALNGAKPVHIAGLFRMSELTPLPEPEPFSTGIDGLDAHYRLRKGDLAVLTGIPGHGKSTIINHIACQMADLHGWTTCFASFEQHPTQDHRRNLIRWKTGLDERDLSHRQLLDVRDWMDSRFSFVVPQEDEDADLGWVLDLTASAVCRHGADMVVLDPWNELDHVVPRESNLTQYTGQALRQLRRFAKKWMVHLLVAAHPTKLHKAADGSLPMPTLYDISDSAHFFNKPDVGMIVHRQGSDSLLRVAKSRYHDRIGKPGTVTLSLDEATLHYHGAGVS